MKTSITLSEKTAYGIMIAGTALITGLFIYMLAYGDFGSIYIAF
jgi:hypothetical protein